MHGLAEWDSFYVITGPAAGALIGLQFEDWLCHGLLPAFAYGTLAVSAVVAPVAVRESFFAVGGATLLLLFAGIHNAWDSVSWHVFFSRRDGD